MATPPQEPAPRATGTAAPLLTPASRAELRAWLAENHASSHGVQLAVVDRQPDVPSST